MSARGKPPADALAEYRRKRRPEATPEPFGPDGDAQGDESPRPSFVIHRHSARRLHYDLRLERGGALASWAVPRGLPLAPGTRRLAVHVEDHPLDYAGFEGVIPAGQYGAGRVRIWDAGTYELVSEKPDGGLTFRLRGRRLQGTWALAPAALDGDARNWLLIRKREEGAAPWPETRYPPMLARLVDEPPGGPGWAHEIKWDGFRVLVRMSAGEPTMWSRRDQDLGERFAAVARRLDRAIATPDCVIDGEVCALDEQGRPRFGLLQRSEGTLVLYAFDLLELEGEPLLERPWVERRELLEGLIEPDEPSVRLSPTFPDGEALLQAAADQGLEGVVSKRLGAPYRPGRRTGDWVKTKTRQSGEFAIAGYRRGRGGRAALGALVLAAGGPHELRWVGNCGAGLGEDAIRTLLDRLPSLERETSPLAETPPELRRSRAGVRWTEPRLACRVSFAEWTDDGRLRAPVFEGLVEPERAAAAPARRVRITNAGKVFFPDEGITKGDLVEYYRAVTPVLVPHIRNRPFTMVRYPDGIAAERFFQKDRPSHMPDWIPVAPLPASTGEGARTIRYPLVNEPDAVLWMVNAGCIDMNAWYSRAQDPERPDYVLFDLDPSEGSGFAEAARVALALREALELMGLRSHVKTSSARGLHVMVPIDPVHTYGEARAFCSVVAGALEHAHRGLVTTQWTKSKRRGVLIDCNQIGFGKTISSVYSVRPRPGAPVSTPVAWDELTPDLDPLAFGMAAVLDRVERLGDLFAPVLGGGQALGPALERLGGGSSASP